jgi:WD40 repeat protein
MTLKAHDKDINALDVAPNGKFVATGSQDKTAKILEVGVSVVRLIVSIVKTTFLMQCLTFRLRATLPRLAP